MVKFERSRERKPRGSSSRGSFRGNSGRKDRRSSGRRDRGDVQMTRVTCSSCGDECRVPFRPTSNKPVYCDDCFSKKGKDNSGKTSNKDFDIINEKLNKIMKALKIN